MSGLLQMAEMAGSSSSNKRRYLSLVSTRAAIDVIMLSQSQNKERLHSTHAPGNRWRDVIVLKSFAVLAPLHFTRG